MATPENEGDLVDVARHTTAAQLERLVHGWRALDRAVDPEGEEESPPEARRADALGLVAESALGRGLGADSVPEENAEPAEETPSSAPGPVVGQAERFQVVVHVEAETLGKAAERAGESRIEGGPHVSSETSRCLACDAGLVVMTHDSQGNVLDVGRRTRTVPPALRRALEHRDGGCRFPGCSSRFCDAHHLRHWADGGETKLENLTLLCRRHHRLLHEEAWRVEMGQSRELRFYRPDGRLLPRVPSAPALGEAPVVMLVREQRGLGIDSWTPTSHWDGERLDVDWALFTLYTPPIPDRNSDRSPDAGLNVSEETLR